MTNRKYSIKGLINFSILIISYIMILLFTAGVTLLSQRATMFLYSKNLIYTGLIVAILSLLGFRARTRTAGEQDTHYLDKYRWFLRDAWRSQRGFASVVISGLFVAITGYVLIFYVL